MCWCSQINNIDYNEKLHTLAAPVTKFICIRVAVTQKCFLASALLRCLSSATRLCSIAHNPAAAHKCEFRQFVLDAASQQIVGRVVQAVEIGFLKTPEHFFCCWVHVQVCKIHLFLTFSKFFLTKNKDLRGSVQFIKNVCLS